MKKLQNLLEDEIRELYAAERQLLKAMPSMIHSAENPILRDAFQTYFDDNKIYFKRVQKICDILNITPSDAECISMQRLLDEFCSMSEEDASSRVIDAGLLSCVKKIEHFEIASYTNALGYARSLGKFEIAKLLEKTLAEEKLTNDKLISLAQNNINQRALSLM